MLQTIKEATDLISKNIMLCLCAYYIFASALPQKPSKRRCIAGALPLLLLGSCSYFLISLFTPFHLLILIAGLCLNNTIVFRCKPEKTVSLSIVSYCLCYGIYMVSGLFFSTILAFYDQYLAPSPAMEVDLISCTWVNVIVFHLFQCITGFTILLLAQNKRLRSGLRYIADFGERDVGLYLSVMMLCTVLFFIYIAHHHIKTPLGTAAFFLVFLCIFSFIFWIRHEIKSVYLDRLREADLTRMEEELRVTEQEIEALRQDNERLASVIHRDNKLIPAMVQSARECLTDAAHSDNSEAALLDAVQQLEELYVQRSKAVNQYENHVAPLAKIGMPSLDAILSYIQRRAAAEGVTLTLDLTSDDLPTALQQAGIHRRQIGTMLADLTENALIAVRHCDNAVKAIAVRMGVNETGQFFFSVCDSGAPFADEVLANIGKKKITTHRDTGGSGIGLVTLFSLLKEYRASFALTEWDASEHEGLTKQLTVTFDGEGRTLLPARRR